jgi:hypothetical protein
LFIWRQAAGRLSGGWANPNRNGGSSKARPINFCKSQSEESLTERFRDSTLTRPKRCPDALHRIAPRIVFDCRTADDPAMIAPTHPARFYGSRRSAIELPGGVNDSSCHEKVDYSCFSALCSGDGAGFLRERFRR